MEDATGTVTKLYSPILANVAAEVEQAQVRLSRLSSIKKKVGIIRMWPDQAVAEHENIERFRSAFKLIGVEIVELDRYGFIIGSPNQIVFDDDVDFVIHLHFETGKVYDVTSVAAMWNPVQFYVDWGFKRFWANQMSHDVYAYTGSEEIRSLILSTFGDVPEALLPQLNHTLSEPIFIPKEVGDYKIFYCGINWEKITGKKGRHDDILKLLDKKELLEIYGPEELQGKKVWDGYNGYCGSLPFDGKTVIEKINKAGVCLVFSSDAHISSTIMSNRLFEAMAGGAVVIGDEHPFIRANLGENYVCVPTWLSPEKRTEIIENAISDFNANPQKAIEMAKAAQKVLLDNYFLSNQLAAVYESVFAHKSQINDKVSSIDGSIVDLIIQPIDNDAQNIIANVREMKRTLKDKANIFIAVNEKKYKWYYENLSDIATIVVSTVSSNTIMRPGEAMEAVGSLLKSKKVLFLLGIETIFGENLLSAAVDLEDVPVARLGFGIKHFDQTSSPHVDFQDLNCGVDDIHVCGGSSILFDTKWLRDNCFIKTFGWRELIKVAEAKANKSVGMIKTCMIINLGTFEKSLAAGINYAKPLYDNGPILSYLSKVSGHYSTDVQIYNLDRPIIDTPKLSGDDMVDKIMELPKSRKWQMAFDLYDSIPFPAWIRKLIHFVRRIVGIK